MTSGKNWKKLKENSGAGVIEIILTLVVVIFAFLMAIR